VFPQAVTTSPVKVTIVPCGIDLTMERSVHAPLRTLSEVAVTDKEVPEANSASERALYWSMSSSIWLSVGILLHLAQDTKATSNNKPNTIMVGFIVTIFCCDARVIIIHFKNDINAVRVDRWGASLCFIVHLLCPIDIWNYSLYSNNTHSY